LARRETIEADYRRLSELYARPIRVCKAVREWRARRWQTPTPDAVARVMRLTKPRPRPRNWVLGVGVPDHGGYCGDPVFATLAPDDTFCG